jgi:hypothetical protein
LSKPIGEGVPGIRFLLTIIGLDGLFLYKFPTFYLVGEWYTGYMLITYIFFPFLFLYGLKKPLLSFLILIGLVVSLHIKYGAIFEMWEPINPLMRLPEFFFGICFAQNIRKDKLLRGILTVVALAILVNTSILLDKIPYHFVLIMGGISFFVIISSVFDIIFIPKYMRELFSQLSRYSFLAFLVHHQILLLFYSAFDVTHSNNFVKFSVLITVITLSFFYGYLVYPLVNYITEKLNNLLFYRNKELYG